MAAGASASASQPSGPVYPELLSEASSYQDVSVTCAGGGGRSFPLGGLTALTGAERASGPEFDALRAVLATHGGDWRSASDWTWRLAGRGESWAIFLANGSGPTEPDALVSVEVEADADGWRFAGMGDCRPHVVLAAEYGPAVWAFDPAFPRPDTATAELHILVWELACSSGALTTGRHSAPLIRSDADSLTITIGVRRLPDEEGIIRTCQPAPGTPVTLSLGERLGTRTLLDGGSIPARAPADPFQLSTARGAETPQQLPGRANGR